jgi:hypothetical protein
MLRTIGGILAVSERSEELGIFAEHAIVSLRGRLLIRPANARPHVYYGLGPDGLATPLPGSPAGAALEEAGASFADVVRSRVYLVDAANFAPISLVHGEVFSDVRPANTTVVVAALLDPKWKVEIEVEAIVTPDSVPR